MGVAKQIPQLQPKAKERKSKKEERGQGSARMGVSADGGQRGCTHASTRTRWRERLNDPKELGIQEGERKWEGEGVRD
jgi:hypothetical protein